MFDMTGNNKVAGLSLPRRKVFTYAVIFCAAEQERGTLRRGFLIAFKRRVSLNCVQTELWGKTGLGQKLLSNAPDAAPSPIPCEPNSYLSFESALPRSLDQRGPSSDQLWREKREFCC